METYIATVEPIFRNQLFGTFSYWNNQSPVENQLRKSTEKTIESEKSTGKTIEEFMDKQKP